MLKPVHTALLPSLILSLSLSAPIFADDQSAQIEAFKHSWTAQALKLQNEIDLNTPLDQATIIGTHNSYNSKAYQIPLIRYIDPNHLLSLYNQLEMGVRSLELDAHWTLSTGFQKDILLCHAKANHVGCGVFDRKFPEGLEEIRDWVKANPNIVILIYIERHLDGHEPRLANELEKYLGDYLYRPTQVRSHSAEPKSCVAIPSTLTKADILKAGKQIVVVVKGCDGTNPHYEETNTFHEVWNDTVFAGIGDINSKPYTFIDTLIGDITPFPDCGKSNEFSSDYKHTSMWRVFEDRTILTDIIHPGKKLLDDDMRQLEQCDINWPTMDMLEIADSRLRAAIWSWAENYPQAGNGNCAMYKSGIGIVNAPCEQTAAYACQEENTHEFKAINISGDWKNGETLCQQMAGDTWHFTMPINGTQMRYLKENMATNAINEVWLDYAMNETGQWETKQK